MNLTPSIFHVSSQACGHEPVSSMTHLVGAVWFACLTRPLLSKAGTRPGDWASQAIFAFSCVLLLSVSGIYHWLPPGGLRDVMRRTDLAAIFLLIAATYTPICVSLYRNVIRWYALGIIWGIALVGILLRALSMDTIPGSLGIRVFLVFGWLGGILALDLSYRRSFGFVKPLVYGGLAYTVGAGILEMGVPALCRLGITSHDLWHIAVLIGIAWHWQFVAQIANEARRFQEIPKQVNPALVFQTHCDRAQRQV